jgi:protein-tyrosine phosphatase
MDVISRFHELLRRRLSLRHDLEHARRRRPEQVEALELQLAKLQTEIDATFAEAAQEER